MSGRSHSRWGSSAEPITGEKLVRSTGHGSHGLDPVSRWDCMSMKEYVAKRMHQKWCLCPVLAATSNDELGGIHACEVFFCFKTDASGTDDDGLVFFILHSQIIHTGSASPCTPWVVLGNTDNVTEELHLYMRSGLLAMSSMLERSGPAHRTQNPAGAVLPTFPPELEREIFLLTARTYQGVSIRLMLIASRVKAWIEPCVYNTVFLRGPKHAFDFLGALVDYRSSEFVQSHVKALCIHPSIPLSLTIQLLAICSGLSSLALWTFPWYDNPSIINLLSSLPLTFLSLNLASAIPPSHSKPALQNHPIFNNLTHLDIVNNWVLWKSSLGVERLPLLTHVAFRFWPRGSAHEALSKILQERSKLEALVLLANSVVIPGAREYLEKQNIRDIRVVVLQHTRDTDEWESMARGAMSMWQRADVIIRWRRRNRAGPFDFPPGFSFGCAGDVFQYSL